jgi:hypothetical protein
VSKVQITDPQLQQFITELFKGKNGQSWSAYTCASNELEVGDATVAEMVRRAELGHPFALPFAGKSIDWWIVLGVDQVDLDQAILRIGRALIPSHALFSPHPTTATLLKFESGKSALQDLGAQLFPNGYYRFESPSDPAARRLVCERLLRWARLEAEKPIVRIATTPTYAELAARFHSATAASQWSEGERAIAELEKYNLCSADNLRFLKIVLLARQGRWHEIWHAPDLNLILQLRLPRAVRAALLAAFHASELAALEESCRFEQAIEVFRTARPLLGTLLSGRFGLEQAPVIMTFAYEAVVTGNRAYLDHLLTLAHPPLAEKLLRLSSLLSPKPDIEPLTPEQRVRAALQLGEFEEALVSADAITNRVRRLVARIEIAARAGEGSLALAVLREVESLPQSERNELEAPASLRSEIELVRATANESLADLTPITVAPPGKQAWKVQDWREWFSAFLSEPNERSALQALDQVVGTYEGTFSSDWANELAELILEAITSQETSGNHVVGDAIDRLAQEAMRDSSFPRDGIGAASLYEALFHAIADAQTRSDVHTQTLFAIADVILSRTPAWVNEAAEVLTTWFHQPYPRLEARALEAIEFLLDYGIDIAVLTTTIRIWVEQILKRPTGWDALRTKVWQELVVWSHAGQDLEVGLADLLAPGTSELRDPIADLPPGYRIAIFTLRPLSAERAKSFLLQRNPQLRIEVCDAKVLTTEARVLAESADLPVIVTQCAKHALTEGIQPILKRPPVYPSGVGSTGILRAICEAAEAGWDRT